MAFVRDQDEERDQRFGSQNSNAPVITSAGIADGNQNATQQQTNPFGRLQNYLSNNQSNVPTQQFNNTQATPPAEKSNAPTISESSTEPDQTNTFNPQANRVIETEDNTPVQQPGVFNNVQPVNTQQEQPQSYSYDFSQASQMPTQPMIESAETQANNRQTLANEIKYSQENNPFQPQTYQPVIESAETQAANRQNLANEIAWSQANNPFQPVQYGSNEYTYADNAPVQYGSNEFTFTDPGPVQYGSNDFTFVDPGPTNWTNEFTWTDPGPTPSATDLINQRAREDRATEERIRRQDDAVEAANPFIQHGFNDFTFVDPGPTTQYQPIDDSAQQAQFRQNLAEQLAWGQANNPFARLQNYLDQ